MKKLLLLVIFICSLSSFGQYRFKSDRVDLTSILSRIRPYSRFISDDDAKNHYFITLENRVYHIEENELENRFDVYLFDEQNSTPKIKIDSFFLDVDIYEIGFKVSDSGKIFIYDFSESDAVKTYLLSEGSLILANDIGEEFLHQQNEEDEFNRYTLSKVEHQLVKQAFADFQPENLTGENYEKIDYDNISPHIKKIEIINGFKFLLIESTYGGVGDSSHFVVQITDTNQAEVLFFDMFVSTSAGTSGSISEPKMKIINDVLYLDEDQGANSFLRFKNLYRIKGLVSNDFVLSSPLTSKKDIKSFYYIDNNEVVPTGNSVVFVYNNIGQIVDSRNLEAKKIYFLKIQKNKSFYFDKIILTR